MFTLKRGFYKTQFKQLAWTTMALAAIANSTLHINNIFEGLVWYVIHTAPPNQRAIHLLNDHPSLVCLCRFLLPCCIIVCNDITAFIWGFFFGRTPLISLSPKKTWEGFIGAFFSTLIFGFLVRESTHQISSSEYYCIESTHQISSSEYYCIEYTKYQAASIIA